MASHTLREIPASDQHACAVIIAKAFASKTNPEPYSYIFTRKETREADLTWFYERRIAAIQGTGGKVFGLYDSKTETLCATVSIGMQAMPSMLLLLRIGMWQWPFRFGIYTLQRLFKIDAIFKPMMSKADGTGAELMMMAVHPDFQGKGLGSRAVELVLRECDEVMQCPDLVLSTQMEVTKEWYTRFGFKVVDYVDDYLPDEPHQYQTWTLRRDRPSQDE